MDANQNQPPAELVGTVLDERYRIEQRLSQGGMGVVYRARHMTLDSDLAVKVLLRPQSDEDRQRFLQEAKLASIIKHPNTVQIIDFGVLPSGQSYLVMELMSGRVLTKDLEKGPMDALRVCQIGAQIARGLQAVHDEGIVHRDLKPDNVFLLEQDGSKDFVKIVDFGIAKPVGSTESPLEQAQRSSDLLTPMDKVALVKTQAGTALGTPPYMSPEQCMAKPLDGRSDQYSLGCMLYQMLSGDWVFRNPVPFKIMMAHCETPPEPLQQRVPKRAIPAALDAAVLRMLAKEPGQRFASMQDVAKALSDIADLMLVERGEKTILPAGVMSLLGSRVQGSHLVLYGRRVSLRLAGGALLGLFVVVLGSAGFLGYRLYQAQRGQKPTLEPGELQTIRAQALAVLRQAMRPESDKPLRIDAIAALAETKDAALRSEFEALLKDPEEPVRAEAAAGLGRLGDGAAIPALKAAEPGAQGALFRLSLARAMLDLGDRHGEELLATALAQGSPEERLRAATMLCDRRNATADKLLLKIVDEGLLKSEAANLGALACLLKSESVEAARARLRSRLKEAPSPEQKIEIARVLSRVGDAEGRRVLRELAAQPGLTQLPAARALSAPDVPEVAELFRRVLRDRQAQDAARLLSSEGLGQSGRLLDVRLIRPFLGRDPAALKTAAAVAVLRLGAADPTALGGESLRWARGSVDASDWQLRESAALVLGDSESSEAVSLLGAMLKDQDARVRRGSVRALGRRPEELALLALKDALRDPDAEVRQESLRSLGRISKLLLKSGTGDVLGRVREWLSDVLASGPPKEQILARLVLLGLGDRTQTDSLRALKNTADPAVRRFLLEQTPADAELARSLLSDADPGVRFAAAQKLAQDGDASGVDVLRQTLAQGGVDSIVAYGLLSRLGQTAEEPASIQTALEPSRSVPERTAAVEALARLPIALAVPLLLKAARDPDPLVRSLCAAVAAELPGDGEEVPGFGVLRLLLSDPDEAVKNRAAALLSRVSLPLAPPGPKAASEPAAKTAASIPATPLPLAKQPSNEADSADGADETPEAAPGTGAETGTGTGTAAGGTGMLILEAPEGTLYQIDGGKWLTWSQKGKPIALPQGSHRLTTLSGEYDVNIESDKKAKLKIEASPVDEAVQFGGRALQQKEYAKALKAFDRASALCGRDREHKKACATLDLTLALDRGRIFEAQKRYSEAMAEFQKALDGGRGKGRQLATEAMSRLSPQLGKVILRSVVKGKCQEHVQWLIPGKKQKIKVGSRSEPVNVSAGKTVEVGSCT